MWGVGLSVGLSVGVGFRCDLEDSEEAKEESYYGDWDGNFCYEESY